MEIRNRQIGMIYQARRLLWVSFLRSSSITVIIYTKSVQSATVVSKLYLGIPSPWHAVKASCFRASPTKVGDLFPEQQLGWCCTALTPRLFLLPHYQDRLTLGAACIESYTASLGLMGADFFCSFGFGDNRQTCQAPPGFFDPHLPRCRQSQGGARHFWISGDHDDHY